MPSDDSPQSSPSPLPPPQSPSQNTLKRKDRPEDDDQVDQKPPNDEYEAGFITCQTCGAEVSFRDDNNKFTKALWDAHRMSCAPSGPPAGSSGPVMYTPDISADALNHPPTKRRRAKRTEEERIQYLRADPYVGQFEPYKVLCASCDKWIRLRPNSTYCSIPWDAHRKSCLAKKINNKNVYALEERNSFFSKDPDVRKFDPERLLCNICDKWMSLPPNDHSRAVQEWLQHRATCQGNATSSSSITKQPQGPDPQRRPGFSSNPSNSSPKGPTTFNGQGSTTIASQMPHSLLPPGNVAPSGSSSSFHALTPSNYAPAHESRRRNAEQRAANLREDPYIEEVEPSRVFCKLCQKWVQLRQDSSYCAYPWMQHRAKCEARHFRRAQKVEVPDMKPRKQGLFHASQYHEEDELMSDIDGAPGPSGHVGRRASVDVESEDADSAPDDERLRRKEAIVRADPRHYPSSSSRHHYPPHPSSHSHHSRHYIQQPLHHYKSRSAAGPYGPSSSGHRYAGGSMSQAVSPSAYRSDPRGPQRPRPPPHALSSSSHPHSMRHGGSHRASMVDDMDTDAEGEADADADHDADAEYLNDEAQGTGTGAPPPPQPPITPPLGSGGRVAGGSSSRNMSRGVPRRPWPVGLADLDSPAGRKQFIFGSIESLFSTTYEATDEMSISSLLAYLNAAMPPDKHEDFDTGEVARAVAAMKEKGKIVFEGDILRLTD